MLIACEKHQTVHDLNPKSMQKLIHFYQAQWVYASYTPDAIPAGGSMSSETHAFRSLCPLEDAVSIAKADEPMLVGRGVKPLAQVRRMLRLTEKFRESR